MDVRHKNRKTYSILHMELTPTATVCTRFMNGNKELIHKVWTRMVGSLSHQQLCQLVDHNKHVKASLCSRYEYSDLIKRTLPTLRFDNKVEILLHQFPRLTESIVNTLQKLEQNHLQNCFDLVKYLVFCVDHAIPVEMTIRSTHGSGYDRSYEFIKKKVQVDIQKIHKSFFVIHVPTTENIECSPQSMIPIKINYHTTNMKQCLKSKLFYVDIRVPTFKYKEPLSLKIIHPRTLITIREVLYYLPTDLQAHIIKYLI